MNDEQIIEAVEDELRNQSLLIRIGRYGQELYGDSYLQEAAENLTAELPDHASVRIVEGDELKRRHILPNSWAADQSLILLSASYSTSRQSGRLTVYGEATYSRSYAPRLFGVWGGGDILDPTISPKLPGVGAFVVAPMTVDYTLLCVDIPARQGLAVRWLGDPKKISAACRGSRELSEKCAFAKQKFKQIKKEFAQNARIAMSSPRHPQRSDIKIAQGTSAVLFRDMESCDLELVRWVQLRE